MRRRSFLSLCGAGILAGSASHAAKRSIHTVSGPIAAGDLGVTLIHEHILVDFVGADQIAAGRYHAGEAFQAALPKLKQIHALGCRTFVDCTPAYLGRDPRLLQRLSRASGLYIVTNTGYYGAQNGKFVPAHARGETAEQLAARWIAEWKNGIEGTGIRPGFLKTSVNAAPLSELDARLIRAAALTSRATGLTIASHTGTGKAAMEELAILESERVPARSFIWVHAQNEKDGAFHLDAARRGAWVEFDGVRQNSLDRHLDLVEGMAKADLLGHVLISQDSGWYRVGEPGGGEFRPYDFIFTTFLPRLRERLDERAVRQLLAQNPAAALAPS